MEEYCRFRPPDHGRQVTWEVTKFCNLFCDHCCTVSGPDVERSHEPSTAALISAASELSAAGVTKVQFSGGEPLLREGFLDMVDSIDADRVRIHLASNGYRLTDQVIGRLRDAGLHKLSVSVDGGDATLHDLLRRKSGGFVRTMEGVTRAVLAGIHVGISVTATPSNVGTLESLVTKLTAIGVPEVSFHSVVPVGRAIEHPELMFTHAHAQRLEDEVRRLYAKYGEAITFDHSFGGEGSRSQGGCPAQEKILHIDPSGDVSPCSWLYKLDPKAFTLGNIGTTSLVDIVASRCDSLEDLRSDGNSHCIIPKVQAAAA